jgi:hypothetical protein
MKSFLKFEIIYFSHYLLWLMKAWLRWDVHVLISSNDCGKLGNMYINNKYYLTLSLYSTKYWKKLKNIKNFFLLKKLNSKFILSLKNSAYNCQKHFHFWPHNGFTLFKGLGTQPWSWTFLFGLSKRQVVTQWQTCKKTKNL